MNYEPTLSNLSNQVLDFEQIHEKIKSDLKSTQRDLKTQPIIDAGYLNSVSGFSDDSSFEWVNLDQIVGRPFSNYNGGGWSFEYDNRKGRVEDIKRQLESNNSAAIENVYHFHNKNERIKLYRYNGPSGPIYSVQDGTHRIAGSMHAGLKHIPVEVKDFKYPIEIETQDKEKIDNWKRKIRAGLINAEIIDGGETIKFIIKSEVFPWIRIVNQYRLLAINEIYSRIYTDAFNDLDIPKECFLDEIANNYLLDGRLEQWKENNK